MAFGGPGNPSSTDVFQARLKTDLEGVSSTLTLLPYKGNKVFVGGQNVTIPNGGLTRLVGDNLITLAGADSGAPGVASTLYYVYVSNSKATFSPSSIRLSATPPTLVNGVKYLGAAGNAANWRFVGWVRLNATPQFESSVTSRTIVNYYNTISLKLFTCPGYVNDGATTAWTATPGGAYVVANAGVGARVAFISNGEDLTVLRAIGDAEGTGNDCRLGIGFDGSISPETLGNIGNSSFQFNVLAEADKVHVEGYRTADMLVGVIGTLTFLADLGGFGAAPDPPATYLIGYVKG